jgi:hypothetical protein
LSVSKNFIECGAERPAGIALRIAAQGAADDFGISAVLKLKVMAASRAFTSALLFVLWFDKNSSLIRPSGNLENVQVYARP